MVKNVFAPTAEYDKIIKIITTGKIVTVGAIRDYFTKINGADSIAPITADIFVLIAAWAREQRTTNKTPYWQALKANVELNENIPAVHWLKDRNWKQKDMP